MNRYKIGEKYVDSAFPNCKYTILAISPKKDYTGNLSYFCEVEDSGNGIYYDVQYEDYMNEWLVKVE